MGRFIGVRDNINYICNIRKGAVKMIYQTLLLIIVILNLAWISILAFKGKKNLLLIFAILEAVLSILFAVSF